MTAQTASQHYGSSSVLVIQGHGSIIATSESRVTYPKILINQRRNEDSSHDRLGHQRAFTKTDDEPNGLKLIVTYYYIMGYGNSCRVHSRAVWTGACAIPCGHASVHGSDQLPQLLVRDS
jgi:hypothetical protein